MRKNLRSVGALVVAGLVATTLAACGGDSEAGDAVSDEPAGTAENPVELRFRWWGGEERQARQLEAIELFESENPDIRINPEPVSMDGYFDTLGVEMAARNAPDIFTLGGSWPLEYGGRGGLFDMNKLPGVDMSPFSSGTLTDATIGDEVFGVPTGGNATGLVVNKDVFAAAGVELPDDDSWTWDDFISIANEIQAASPEGTFGVELRPQDFAGAFVAQRNGLGLYNEDGTLAVDEATLADFFTLFTELMDSGATPNATLYSELVNVGPEETLMGRGLAGMIFAPSNQITALAEASGADLALLRIPGETEFESVGTAVLPSQWFSVSAHTEYPEAAGRFVNFLVNDPRAGEILGVDRGNPLSAAVAEHIAPNLTPIEQEQVNFMTRVAEHAGQGVPQPQGAGEAPGITQRAVDEVIFGRQTPEQAAQQFLQQLQAALDAAQ